MLRNEVKAVELAFPGNDSGADGAAKPVVIEVAEIAAALHLGINQVYAALNRGEIPSHRVGRRFIVSRRRFFQWLENGA
jgi:excisionase family DNA binding protein